MFAEFMILFATIVGIGAGVACQLLPASGKAGLAFGLLPLLGLGVSMAFC